MRCTFCSRQSVNEFPEKNLFFCESCGRAYREGFEHGKVYESIRRRKGGGGMKFCCENLWSAFVAGDVRFRENSSYRKISVYGAGIGRTMNYCPHCGKPLNITIEGKERKE